MLIALLYLKNLNFCFAKYKEKNMQKNKCKKTFFTSLVTNRLLVYKFITHTYDLPCRTKSQVAAMQVKAQLKTIPPEKKQSCQLVSFGMSQHYIIF